MTRKQIDAAREARLWIGQIIVPTLTLAATVMTIPEVRQKANHMKNVAKLKTNNVKMSIKSKFKREGA